MVVCELATANGYPISVLCEIAGIARSAYYKWKKRSRSQRELENEVILEKIKTAYEERNGILGYRLMTIVLRREHALNVNHKRIYRLMRVAGLKSVCRQKRYSYIKSTPEAVAENILNRNFTADNVCQKWLTDVTEMKCANGEKLYLSAILDLGDKSIVSYAVGRSNNNAVVFETVEKALAVHRGAKPLFHSDRGFQYTSKAFRAKLDEAGMTQSMSRVGHCIDNGLMEAFWGTMKSEMYYLHRFKNSSCLRVAIDQYIYYYNNRRYQRRLNCMTPLEYRYYLLGREA